MVGEDIYERGFSAIKAIIARQRAEERSRSTGGSTPAVASAPAQAVECGAVVLARHGGPEVLEWRRVSVPPPGVGEVRVKQTVPVGNRPRATDAGPRACRSDRDEAGLRTRRYEQPATRFAREARHVTLDLVRIADVDRAHHQPGRRRDGLDGAPLAHPGCRGPSI
jgi:hypothetical protein